jgi:integrase
MNANAPEAAPNVIALALPPKAKPAAAPSPFRARFKILAFTNRAGSQSWRVTGIRRDGSRVRENFRDPDFAKNRQIELEAEYLSRTDSQAALRATRLNDVQLRLCEAALIKLDRDEDLLPAVDYWLKQGRAAAVPESPRLDEAVDAFLTWLSQTDTLRSRTKSKYRIRVNLFRHSIPDLRVVDISADVIAEFLSGRKRVSALTKVGDREAISRFFSWCAERPRQWLKINPCREIRVEKSREAKPPEILSVEECKRLLIKAATHRRGRLAPYIAACLFGGLRPAEAQRLTWDKVNLADREIRVEAQSTKTRQPRVVSIAKPLSAWLEAFKGKPFHPANLRRDLEVIKLAAGYTGRGSQAPLGKLKPWPADVLRHTAISHFFRKTGSYGLTAEQFGNSEAIIKKHYQGRVSSEDTRKFYALFPRKGCK